VRFDRIVLFNLLWLLPVAFWPGSNSYESVKFTILALAVALWLGNAAWQRWNGHQHWPSGIQGLCISGSLVFVLGSGFFTAENPALVVRTALLISLFAFVVYQTRKQKGELPEHNSLLVAVCIGASAAGIYGLLQIAHLLPGAPVSSGFPPGISTLGNQNYLAGLMAVTFWPTLVLWRQTSNKWTRLLAVATLLIILSTLAVAQATGPQIAVLAAGVLVIPCIILVLKNQAKQAPILLGSLMILLGGIGLGLIWEATFHQQGANNSPTKNASLHHTLLAGNHGDIRFTDWQAAISMMQRGPAIVGIGAGNYLVQWPSTRAHLSTQDVGFDRPWGAHIATRAHNDLLQWVAETGIAGSIWLTLTLCYAAFAWRRRFLDLESRNQINQLLLTGGILTVAVHSMVSFPFHLPTTSLVTALLIGLVFLHEKQGQPIKSKLLNRTLSLVLATVSIVIAFGCLQEFRGDLLTASGRNYFIQGQMQRAVFNLEKGTRLMRWPGHGHLYLGLTRSALGQERLAANDFKISLTDRPSFEAHLALAEASIAGNDFNTAEFHLALVKACRPNIDFYNQAGYFQGVSLVRQGRLDAAKSHFVELLQENPKLHRVLLGLGYIEVLQGHPEQGKILYGQCLKIIDEKIAEVNNKPIHRSAPTMVRLQENRRVTVKALESLVGFD